MVMTVMSAYVTSRTGFLCLDFNHPIPDECIRLWMDKEWVYSCNDFSVLKLSFLLECW